MRELGMMSMPRDAANWAVQCLELMWDQQAHLNTKYQQTEQQCQWFGKGTHSQPGDEA